MIAKLTDFKQSLIRELTEFIRNQADALSLRDLYQLITDLPAARERFRTIPVQTYVGKGRPLRVAGPFNGSGHLDFHWTDFRICY
jgi:hypothetical protein